MNNHEEQQNWIEKRTAFFDAGEWVLPSDKDRWSNREPAKFAWDNFEAAERLISENPGSFIYTLVEENNTALIRKGFHYKNRQAYFISKREVPIYDEKGILYWKPGCFL